MFYYCFVDDSLMMLWRDIVETLINSKEAFLIFISFVVLTSESLMFHCFFLDDSLMTLWRTIDETTSIWTQTLLINKDFNVLFFKFWCFIAAWLIKSCWWFFEETFIRSRWFRCKKYWKMFFVVLISETLMFLCCFLDDRWWHFRETNLKHWYFRWKHFWSLLFLFC